MNIKGKRSVRLIYTSSSNNIYSIP